MSDDTATEDTAVEAPVLPRVPNVTRNARSGLTGALLNPPVDGPAEVPAGEDTAPDPDAPQTDTSDPQGADQPPAYEPVIPEDVHTVEALLAWVHEPDDEVEQVARASVVLEAEDARPADEQRVTLLSALRPEDPGA